jgi:hypothetical protein
VGFMHASTLIRLGSLRRMLPEKQTADAGEIMEVTLKRQGLHLDCICHPTIKTFLDETSLDPGSPLVSDERNFKEAGGLSLIKH